MPCRDDSDLCIERSPEDEQKIDELTRFLCEACSVIQNKNDKTGTYIDRRMSPELQKWWDRHQEFDRKRIAEEQAEVERQNKIQIAKQKLHSTLTIEEMELLGILL